MYNSLYLLITIYKQEWENTSFYSPLLRRFSDILRELLGNFRKLQAIKMFKFFYLFDIFSMLHLFIIFIEQIMKMHCSNLYNSK